MHCKPSIALTITLLIASISLYLGSMVFAQDEEPPVIEAVRFDTIGETWFTVGWTTSEPAHGGVEWGRDETFGNMVEEEPAFSRHHYLNVTGLNRDSYYSVRIIATDESNNTGFSEIWSVGTYPIGWEDRFLWNYGWSIIAILVAITTVVIVIFLVSNRNRNKLVR